MGHGLAEMTTAPAMLDAIDSIQAAATAAAWWPESTPVTVAPERRWRSAVSDDHVGVGVPGTAARATEHLREAGGRASPLRRRATTDVAVVADNDAREELALLRASVRDALAAGAQLDDLGIVVDPHAARTARWRWAWSSPRSWAAACTAGPAYDVMVGNLVAAELGIDADAAFVTGDALGIIDPTVAVPPETFALIATGDTLAGALVAAAQVDETPVDGRHPPDRPLLGGRNGSGCRAAGYRRTHPNRTRPALRRGHPRLHRARPGQDRRIRQTTHHLRRSIGKYQAVAHRLVDHTITARQLR